MKSEHVEKNLLICKSTVHCSLIDSNTEIVYVISDINLDSDYNLIVYKTNNFQLSLIPEIIFIKNNIESNRILICSFYIERACKSILSYMNIDFSIADSIDCCIRCETRHQTKQALLKIIKKTVDLHKVTDPKLSSILKIIIEDIGGSTQSSIARSLKMSPTNISRILKKNLGLNYREFMSDLKYRLAKTLEAKNKDLAEISELIGYSEISNLKRFIRNKKN